MIYTLSGVIKHKGLSDIIIDVAGVGYGVELPAVFCSVLDEPGKPCCLWIYTRVKEDELKLYGFLEKNQRDIFEILLNVSGIGPKLALAILSCLSVAELIHSIEIKDADAIEEVPGIGRRSAEKIILDLQSKLKKIRLLSVSSENNKKDTKNTNTISLNKINDNKIITVMQDLASALENLGFKDKQISTTIKSIKKSYQGESFEDLIRKALELLKGENIKLKDKKTHNLDIQKIF